MDVGGEEERHGHRPPVQPTFQSRLGVLFSVSCLPRLVFTLRAHIGLHPNKRAILGTDSLDEQQQESAIDMVEVVKASGRHLQSLDCLFGKSLT